MKNNDTIVLIPHYNNIDGLIKSVKSISGDIDILIIDDGSSVTPNQDNIKQHFTANGELYIKYASKNVGIENALNIGIEEILKKDQYQFIARLDCGDICINNRIQKQKSFLQENEDIAIVGSNVIFTNKTKTTTFKVTLPEENSVIKKKMYLNAMLIHPTFFFRTKIIKSVGFYPTEYKSAEDLAFLFEIMKKHKLANINEFLVECEYNTEGISVKSRKTQIKSRIKLILKHFKYDFYPILGLIKACIAYCIPVRVITFLKTIKK